MQMQLFGPQPSFVCWGNSSRKVIIWYTLGFVSQTLTGKLPNTFWVPFKSLGYKSMLWCGLRGEKYQNATLICSRNVIWESMQNFWCPDPFTQTPFVDLTYCALKSSVITVPGLVLMCSEAIPKCPRCEERRILVSLQSWNFWQALICGVPPNGTRKQLNITVLFQIFS